MTEDKLQELESPLYIYEGAELPAEYSAENNCINKYECDETRGFWGQRLRNAANSKPKMPDWVFGIFMPAFCFVADPVVFKNPHFAGGYLGDYSVFAYLLCSLSIVALIVWLRWGERLRGFAVLVSGIMAVGSLASLLIGILLLPLSLIGLVFLIGLLGFTPFFTSSVYWRNSMRAYLAAKPYFDTDLLARTVGLVALVTLVLPMIANALTGKNMIAHLLEIITRYV